MKSFAQHTQRIVKQEHLTEAFTRQHYVAIAEEIDNCLAEVEEATDGNEKAIDAVATMAKRLATMFKNDNPQFDKNRFLSACGVNH